jgi:hypothetical protein
MVSFVFMREAPAVPEARLAALYGLRKLGVIMLPFVEGGDRNAEVFSTFGCPGFQGVNCLGTIETVDLGLLRTPV